MSLSRIISVATLFVGLVAAGNFTFSYSPDEGLRLLEGFTDGVYQIQIPMGDATSNPIIRRMEPGLQQPEDAESPQLSRRLRPVVPLPVYSSWCKKGRLNVEDYEEARYQFLAVCDQHVIPQRSAWFHFGVSGLSFVYVCSFGGENMCDRLEFDWAEDYIRNTLGCGAYQPAGVYMEKWRKEYGRANLARALDICPDSVLFPIWYRWYCTWNPEAVDDLRPPEAWCQLNVLKDMRSPYRRLGMKPTWTPAMEYSYPEPTEEGKSLNTEEPQSGYIDFPFAPRRSGEPKS